VVEETVVFYSLSACLYAVMAFNKIIWLSVIAD
jgi:hypothetical protein